MTKKEKQTDIIICKKSGNYKPIINANAFLGNHQVSIMTNGKFCHLFPQTHLAKNSIKAPSQAT